MTHRIATILGFALLAACGGGESPAADSPADGTAQPPAAAQPSGGDSGAPTPSAGGEADRPRAGAPDSAAPSPAAAAGADAPGSGATGGNTAARAGRGAAAPLYTVQVAAFLSADSARAWSDRLGRAGLPAWTTTAEVDGRTFHRLRVGAHPEAAGARRLGDRVRRVLHWPVWVAPVDRHAELPEDVVARTRALIDAR